MTAIDRAAVIEEAAKEMYELGGGYAWEQFATLMALDAEGYRSNAEAVLPVVARKLLAPLRELHFAKSYTCIHLRPPGELGPCCRRSICADCNQMHPCLTVRLLDQIETEVRHG